MKNSKFNPLFESIYDRFREGSGFLAGDVVKLKSGYESMDCYKSLAENVKQRVQDMVKTGNNIRIGRLHNKHSGYGALGGPIHPACHVDLYEEVAPSFWRNLVTVPVDVLEGVDTGVNLPPVPDGQKDTRDRVTEPKEVSKDKGYKSKETDEQTKIAEKQTHAKKGDYELATKNTVLAHSNKYNDSKPSKVKNLEKAKEVNESYENIYERMLVEDVGVMGSSANMEEIDTQPSALNSASLDTPSTDAPSTDTPVANDATLGNALPTPQDLENMPDEEVLSTFRNAAANMPDRNEFAAKMQELYTATKSYNPELAARIGNLLKAPRADLEQSGN